MKKYLLLISLLVCSAIVHASSWQVDSAVNRSSYTATADTTQSITGFKPGARFVGVVIGKASSGVTVTVYDSNGTTLRPMALIDANVPGTYRYDVAVSSGITYTVSGAAAGGVTIIWKPSTDATHN